MPLTLYDIPSKLGRGKTLSPCVWRARLCLNYKGLSCNTDWVEFPDIEDASKQLGLRPTGTWPDGSPYYSLPAIVDDSSEKYEAISDSFRIAHYLDAAYPETSKVLPDSEEGIQFQKDFPAMFEATVLAPLAGHCLPLTLPMMTDRGRNHYSRSRGMLVMNRASLDDVVTTDAEKAIIWEDFRERCRMIDQEYYAKTDNKGLWILGDTPSYADFVVAAFFVWLALVYGEESQEWKEIREWDNGRWGRIFDEVQQWRGGC